MKLPSRQEITELLIKYKQDTGFGFKELSSILYFCGSSICNWTLGNRFINTEAYIAVFTLLEHEGYLPSCGLEDYSDHINLQALDEIKKKKGGNNV